MSAGLAIIGCGMAGVGMAGSLDHLLLARLVAGFGVSGLLAGATMAGSGLKYALLTTRYAMRNTHYLLFTTTMTGSR